MGKGAKILKTQLNRIKDGRGQGYGKEYKPFIQVSDNKTPADGYLIRERGWITERVHHVLSKEEWRYLMVLTWSDNIVVDIREQYPLLPIERTIEIAEQLNIQHHNIDKEPVIATTDFVITVETENGLVDKVRTNKPAKDLTPRQLELFQIEKTFFEEQGLDWGIIIDKNLPSNLVFNVDWLYDGKFLDTRPGLDHEVVQHVSEPLFQKLASDKGNTAIEKLCLQADRRFGLEVGSSTFILKHQLANRCWETDMINQRIRLSKPLLIWRDEQ